MADLTKAQLAARVLEHLGVKAASESAVAVDQALVEEAIDSSHDELRKLGLVPFATSAIPTWAQNGLRDYVETEVKPAFGFPMSKAVKEQEQNKAKAKLQAQVSSHKQAIRVRPEFY